MKLQGIVPQKYKAESVRVSPPGFPIHPSGNGRGNNAICIDFHHAS